MIDYNYEKFLIPEVEEWLNFENSPVTGSTAPDFPLWQLKDQSETSLSEWWSKYTYIVVEFGSFT